MNDDRILKADLRSEVLASVDLLPAANRPRGGARHKTGADEWSLSAHAPLLLVRQNLERVDDGVDFFAALLEFSFCPAEGHQVTPIAGDTKVN